MVLLPHVTIGLVRHSDGVAWKTALGVGGAFMLVDAIISMGVPNDKRPWLQAGRVLRAAVGFGFGVVALAAAPGGRMLAK
jgi:hypothetical protein